jgi:hypothetical protein
MNKQQKVMSILELSALYDDFKAIWWLTRDEFPCELDYRGFVAQTEKWENWVTENVNVIQKVHSLRSNDTDIKLKNIIGSLVKNPNVLISWKYSTSSKGNVTIAGLKLLYSINDNKFGVEDFDKEIKQFKIQEEKKSQVYMVVQRQHGLDLQDFEIDIPTMDIDDNYGQEWVDKHERLLEAFTIKKKKGIALLHGLPGTGKSMYIRNLIATLCEDRTIIYLPNQLINCITDPGFIPLMAEYANSILVIEDADEAIKSRKTGGTSVDKLLNLADGILSDFLGTQIICTFNNDISLIDDALLRKGRLIIKHEFGKLSIEASQKLSNKLGFKTTITEDMTLAEIYNQDDTLSDIEKKNSKIGFGR